MGKFGFVGVFVVVAVAHYYALKSYVKPMQHVAKPKVTIQRITLSRVEVRKPVVVPPAPMPEPIILPPEPEPKPIVKPRPKPRPKKKVHKKRPKKRVKKPKLIKPPIKKPVEVVQKPVLKQVIAPVVQIDTASIRDAYTSEIRRQIQRHLYYPKMAKRLRMQGVVRVAFRVLKDGKITDIRVINSSKKLLSRGAIKTLKALSLNAIPKELHESFMDINIPIEFRLVKG